MVFLLPLNSAHAAGPTVTLSTLSSGVLTAATSGTVGTTLTIEGFGFLPATPITITSTVGTSTVSWLNNPGSAATTNGGISSASKAVDSLVTSGCLITTAVGNFAVEANVPAMPGGVQTVSVSDGTNTGTAAFSVTPRVSFSASATANYGFPEQNIGTGTFAATGFGASETVTFATTAFTAASLGGSPSCLTGTTGSCSPSYTTANLIVADTTGGAKTITATGATSGLTATTTYTINPWAAFYNSAAGVTTFSFIGTAPTSVLIEAHGLPAGTIAANSITIGGVATNHAAVTVGASGTIGVGGGAQLVVSPSAQVPYGVASVVIAGTTFSYAAGNIAQSSTGTLSWGGALISSIAGSAGTTGVAAMDASSYKPGAQHTPSTGPGPIQNQMAFFGYGFVPGNAVLTGGAISISTPTGASFLTGPTLVAGNLGGGAAGAPDQNGAFFAIATLGDTPWSAVATPTTAASYSPIVTQASHAPANILSPSFGITPWIDTSSGAITPSSTVDYTMSIQFAVHGFGGADTVTATIGGAAMVSGGTCPASSSGACSTGQGKSLTSQAAGRA